MQVELTASLLVEVGGFFLTIGGILVAAAVMIKSTAKEVRDAVKEFKEEKEKREKDHDTLINLRGRVLMMEKWLSNRGMPAVRENSDREDD